MNNSSEHYRSVLQELMPAFGQERNDFTDVAGYNDFTASHFLPIEEAHGLLEVALDLAYGHLSEFHVDSLLKLPELFLSPRVKIARREGKVACIVQGELQQHENLLDTLGAHSIEECLEGYLIKWC